MSRAGALVTAVVAATLALAAPTSAGPATAEGPGRPGARAADTVVGTGVSWRISSSTLSSSARRTITDGVVR